ncbi:MAG: DUF4199 family protein [Crocinitomicaceae bacterium]|nr:DUF4199 family protein [Crocinitomicaceae bacterium]
MKTSVKIGLFFALIWIIITMILYLAGISKLSFRAMVLVNIFFLMASVSVGLFLTKRESKFDKGFFLEDFKTSMQSGIVYSLIISSFVYLYHAKIDQSIRQDLIDAQIEAIHTNVPDSETYAEMQAKDPTWKDKGYDDYIELMEDQATSMISASSVFIAHLMGLTFFSFFFAFFTTVIMRFIVLREVDARR